MTEITLYGTPLSIYAGRPRSYLIKTRRPYRETTPITKYYYEDVLPRAGGRQSVPTIETADGEVIRDGAAIIDHYENATGNQWSPTTPKQRIISRLFDVIGAEGLLRPAFHYRWDFPAENMAFLLFHFETMVWRVPDRAKKAQKIADGASRGAKSFGAVPENFELIETLYLELLEKLDAHFSDYPYLLGGKPCIGDFGMMAPFYGHLGRDPKPLSLMQSQAIRLFRWVERMNRPEPDVGEFEVQDDAYLANDEVPDSLLEVLRHISIDFVPETQAAATCINEWIGQQPQIEPGTVAERGVGQGTFTVRGTTISALAQPYRFYLLQRVHDEYEALDKVARVEVDAMLAACDMTPILSTRLTKLIGRDNNLEVWAD